MNVISQIKPSKDEQLLVENITKEFLKKLSYIKKVNFIVGGSVSKDTWLKATKEVDIFAKFKNYDKNISDILYKQLKKKFDVDIVHGSRDYFHINYRNLIFEIVPILDIKKPEQAQNVTDLSPLHIKFVKKFSKLKDEIRLLKAFCKANSLYGAESYISGFSGYALEVLTIYYKSFKNVLKNAAKWKPKVIIDINKKLKNPLFELNPSKTVSPLILIDPVDKNRNIAASLSLDNFNKFVKLSQLYLREPSERFFFKENKIPSGALVIKIIPLPGKKDLIGDKIVKTIDFIKNELTKNGFIIKDNNWFWGDEVIFWFFLREKKIGEYYLHKGPPENMVNNVREFKKKHKKVFIKNGTCYTNIKREFTKVEDYFKKISRNNYIKERVKEIKLWK